LTKPKNRSKSYDAGSPEFFATFGWCCIYCEGSRLAREYRLKQIESLETSEIENEISAEFEDFNPAFETKASDLGKTGRALQNIFDLVPDHLFPVWIQNLPDLPWESEGKQKAERVWVASAHRSCNSRRKKRLENVDFLLFVYSRFIFPALRLSEKEKVLDMLAFAEVLRQLELYKERHQLAELKPDRRAM